MSRAPETLDARALLGILRPFVDREEGAEHDAVRVVSITPSCETWLALHRGTVAAICRQLERAAGVIDGKEPTCAE